ncbi:endo-alpha-N-acetylgalactosaminidase family protein [Paenibacillus spongiae]|uniref:Endo-alpha-N-acetylgalactosaminidase family protein n=1 Tax=Paenibacillus spongiae TaxID=2909671 RepID=A0ABY5SGP1_9BACL|nr:endo-alpha-N-acetylgalactosaminidase family protein [Paenibacillus spongiae]UVI33172.1 endo-alpha-N-acetylgalactosaminidase family protein [Paenibacillus spongiae]
MWNIVKGAGHWKAAEEAIELKANGSDTLIVNVSSPALADGELAFTLTPLNPQGKIGALIRYASPESWVFIGCDKPMDPFGQSTWIWSLPSGEQGILFKRDPLYEGKAYRIKLRYMGSLLTVWIDDYQAYHGHIPQMKQETGRTGFRVWASEADREQDEGYGRISGIKEDAVSSLFDDRANSDDVELQACDNVFHHILASEELEVRVDDSFPKVLEYRWRATGAVLYGQDKRLACLLINGDGYEPVVRFHMSGNEASYRLSFPEIQVDMTVIFKVNDTMLEMSITDIRETGEFRVMTIEFPHHSLVSVRSVQERAHAACAEGIKGDHLFAVNGQEEAPVHAYYSIAILNTNELAATVLNNVLTNRRRVCVRTVRKNGFMETGLWNSYWTYRGPDGEVVGEPWAKVVITSDRNGDGIVDWQDGAIAYREVKGTIPGAEMLRNSYAHIAMNFASMAQNPFLRILDHVKKFYLYSDGFGQMIELKGYQSEGHDSGHPDYGSINGRAGGISDLNLLVDRSLAYGAAIGVHINHSEAYPEAEAYTDSIMTTTPGWRWLDQSFYIDREKDIMSGGFDRRLDELRENVPNVSFVYVDTYRDEHWAAYRLVKKLHDNGWVIWTEEADMLDQHAIWTHDSTGDSVVSRFIHHTDKDAYDVHPLLKGGYTRAVDNGFMGWQRERDLTAAIESFFTKQLPYRYLMHFPIMKWMDAEIILEGNVISRLEDGEAHLYRNGIRMASGNTVFIPWDPHKEDKIYHWNPAGGESTWTLPESWQKRVQVTESDHKQSWNHVKLYRLTDLGRVFVSDLPVTEGTVTISAEARTPYVIYPSEAPPLAEIIWGEGSPVKDMGFDSHGFIYWKKSSTSPSTDHISIRNTRYGQSYLHISGNGGADAEVSQEMTGLEYGKTYSASVWVQVSEGRSAAIIVAQYGGPDVIKEINRTAVVNWDIDSGRRETYYQRLRLTFTIPDAAVGVDGTRPILVLRAGAGDTDSYVHFDDVRVRELGNSIQQDCDRDHYYYEDFEDVDEGWGPFVSSNSMIGKTHLSRRHAGYTNDTIGGDWSMKTMDERSGELFRTLPSTVLFDPNQRYRIMFDYKADHEGQYTAVIRAVDGDTLMECASTALKEGLHRFEMEFMTNRGQDHYFAIVKNDDARGALVLDHFTVDYG